MAVEDYLPQRTTFAKAAKQYRGVQNSDANSFGAFIMEDGSYAQVGRWVCHGWLQTYNIESGVACRAGLRLRKQDIKYMLSAVMCPHANVTKGQQVAFIDWLINRSPWAVIFVDKNADSVYDYGYLVDANHPTPFITSAMMASRFMTESYNSTATFRGRCEVYKELLQICTEDEAFFFAHLYAPASERVLYPITFNRLSSGHATFYGSGYGKEYVKNFLSHTPILPKMLPLAKKQGYDSDSINRIWGSSREGEAWADRVKDLRPIVLAAKVDYNIFRKAPKEGFAYTTRENFVSVISQLKRIIYA